LYEVDYRKKKEGFVGGKAFRAGTELAVDGGMKVLEGGEEVDGGSLKKGRRRKKIFETKTAAFLGFKFRP
jgi:hypothetical protein